MPTVYFSTVLGREEFVEKILRRFQPQLKNARKIFIKPNIVSYEPHPTTTHPDMLNAVLSRLAMHEVLVGDAPAIDAGRSNKIIQESDLREVCDRYGVKLLNLYGEEMKTVRSPRGYQVKVSSIPLKCDFVISLPVLKVHHTVGLSGALKNQFGYLSKKDRLLMHAKLKSIDRGIVESNAAVPTNLFIVDGIETMVKAQECRHGGCPAKLNALMAGTDPVSLDVFGLQLLEKIEPEIEEKRQKAWRYLKLAIDYGLGKEDFELKTLAP